MRKMLLFGLLALLLALPFGATQAQETVISVALPEYLRSFSDDTIFDNFEAQHPGVRVHPVYISFDAMFAPSPAADLDEHLEAIEELVSSADVIPITSDNLSVEATRAGYLLDLAPLANTDASLNVGDFAPAAYQSFQWDNGLWALPISMDTVSLIYNPAAFDRAGLTYPNEAWTIDDFENAARALTEYDANGAVKLPGLVILDYAWLVRALYGRGLYDASTVPNAPDLTDPAFVALLERMLELEEEGIFSQQLTGEVSMDELPMRVMGTNGLLVGGIPGQEVQPVAASLLPGGISGLDATGFGVSSGSLYPDLAYELVKYMTNTPQIISMFFEARPARQSLNGMQPELGGGAIRIARPPMSPEHEAFIDQAFARALPMSELRYREYARAALEDILNNNTNPDTAFQNAELQAAANLQAAADRRSTTSILVATPPPQVVMNPGEIALNFGLAGGGDIDAWEALAREFAEADPQVGQINIDTRLDNAANYAERNDCFYTRYNAVPAMDLTDLLNLDPFLDADPNFDRNDIVGGVMASLQRDNRTWGYPLAIQPSVLRYHRDLFAAAGIPTPENGWTFSEFVNALSALKPGLEEDREPFNSRGFGNTTLLMLITAAGGLPLDYRTNPMTVNLTDPATVDAIRQVLDLAKNGLISYTELASTVFMMSVTADSPDPIYSDNPMGNAMVIGGRVEIGQQENPYGMATYPSGSTYNAVTYELHTAYISASAQNPDACYRWFAFLSQHPELFNTMPVRRSQFNNPALLASQGSDAAAFYSRFDALINNPNTIVFPSQFSGRSSLAGSFIINYWLNKVFDDYVLRDGDLVTGLQDAQAKAEAYQECAANIPPYDPGTTDARTYTEQVQQCAVSIDPDAAPMFVPLGA